MTARAPNVLLIMSDQHRADMMGCAGDTSVITPSLDALAAEGVRFSRVACQGPLCMPSRASFMTERYVRDHGVFTNWEEIAADSPTYAWALREAGYHTSLLGKAHLYTDEKLEISHIDEAAGRLEAVGFAEVFETGDKFAPKARTKYTDYLAARDLLDSYRRHIADRSYQGENEDGQGATKCVPMWDSTPMPLPLDAYVDTWHGIAGRPLDRPVPTATSPSFCSSAFRGHTTRGTPRRRRSPATPASTSPCLGRPVAPTQKAPAGTPGCSTASSGSRTPSR